MAVRADTAERTAWVHSTLARAAPLPGRPNPAEIPCHPVQRPIDKNDTHRHDARGSPCRVCSVPSAAHACRSPLRAARTAISRCCCTCRTSKPTPRIALHPLGRDQPDADLPWGERCGFWGSAPRYSPWRSSSFSCGHKRRYPTPACSPSCCRSVGSFLIALPGFCSACEAHRDSADSARTGRS